MTETILSIVGPIVALGLVYLALRIASYGDVTTETKEERKNDEVS